MLINVYIFKGGMKYSNIGLRYSSNVFRKVFEIFYKLGL